MLRRLVAKTLKEILERSAEYNNLKVLEETYYYFITDGQVCFSSRVECEKEEDPHTIVVKNFPGKKTEVTVYNEKRTILTSLTWRQDQKGGITVEVLLSKEENPDCRKAICEMTWHGDFYYNATRDI